MGDAYVSSYFRRHGCGVIVDEREPVAVAQALERILGDAELRGRIPAAAWESARTGFHPDRARAAFADLVGLGR